LTKQYKASSSSKKRKYVKKISNHRREELAEYRLLRDAWMQLPENRYCVLKFPGVCSGYCEAPQHVKGRAGKMLLNVDEWIPSCNACNREAERQDKSARAAGFKKSRLGPSSKQILYKPTAPEHFDGGTVRFFEPEIPFQHLVDEMAMVQFPVMTPEIYDGPELKNDDDEPWFIRIPNRKCVWNGDDPFKTESTTPEDEVCPYCNCKAVGFGGSCGDGSFRCMEQ
jgi:hypothetical protein